MDMNWKLFAEMVALLIFCATFTWVTFAIEQYLENERDRLGRDY